MLVPIEGADRAGLKRAEGSSHGSQVRLSREGGRRGGRELGFLGGRSPNRVPPLRLASSHPSAAPVVRVLSWPREFSPLSVPSLFGFCFV